MSKEREVLIEVLNELKVRLVSSYKNQTEETETNWKSHYAGEVNAYSSLAKFVNTMMKEKGL